MDSTRDSRSAGDEIHATISGPVSGQIAVGRQNVQTANSPTAPAVSEADLRELREAFSRLKALVVAEAPAEQRDDALGHIAELEQAVLAEKPDLSTMEYVRQWFGRNLPKLAGVVGSVVVHPIVGVLVQAAGETLAAEFRMRFGTSSD
jgi:hypothetical protein